MRPRHLTVVPDDAVTQIIPVVDDATVWVSPGPRQLSGRAKILVLVGFVAASWAPIVLGVWLVVR